jgi:hypothetical protein
MKDLKKATNGTMMKAVGVIIAAALLLAGALLEAQDSNPALGKRFLEFCSSHERAMKASSFDNDIEAMRGGQCAGYISGVADAMGAEKLDACFPNGTNHGHYFATVLKFLRDHPERLHEQRYILVRDALRAAFPCSATK